MSGITAIMDIAKRALAAEQLGVEVTSHNVANVNTPGYSRQEVNYVTAYPVPSPWGPLGNGVKVQGITRAFDPFIAARLDQQSATLSEYRTLAAQLEQVAGLFNETQAGGLTEHLSAFFAAWHDLADHPVGSGERQALLQEALSLTEACRYRADQLVAARTSLTRQLAPVLEEINAHARRIAELNREIQISEANGQQANDLRDQRQQEISALAELVGIRTFTTSDGMVNVTLANGFTLTQGVQAWSLTYEITPADTVAVVWHGPGGLTEDLTAGLSGGRLTALITVRDRLIPRYQSDLDALARELIFAVNALHSQGTGLALAASQTGTFAVTDADAPLSAAGLPFGDRLTAGTVRLVVERAGQPMAQATLAIDPLMSLNDLIAALNTDPALAGLLTASEAGGRLVLTTTTPGDALAFGADTAHLWAALGVNTFFTGDKAYTFGVNAWVLTEPGAIAAGRLDPDGSRAPGDNRTALALADLETAPAGPGGLTFAAAYERLVSSLGLEGESAQHQADFYQAVVDQLTRMRDAVSGVSLDEELANLVKFQRAYQAAARLITIADELYETLLGIKR
ncbi:MAG: flagellar hook-associated protein FlgK [Syntrophobacterales bacterium]|nr:flagellar hook-associated protein FlgK [Syntrophobacterales bacterium]